LIFSDEESLFGEKVSEEVHIEISNGIAIWLYWSIAMWTWFFYVTLNLSKHV
jgi:hypothetical protein